MDAEDIFKKLSRGAKFTRKRAKEDPAKVKLEPSDKSEEIIIKQEKVYSERPQESPLTLLGDLVTVDKQKGKKRKAITEEERSKKIKLLKQEEINHYRNLHNINVVGKNIAEPARSFDDFNVSTTLRNNLIKCGYTEPTPIQKQAIPLLLENRQVLACAPTGSGKTAAFLVPLIHHLNKSKKENCRGLIICPTRELAKQIQRECVRLAEGRNLKINYITKIKKAISQSSKFDILVTTPNKLCFLLKQEPPVVFLDNVRWVIIDEADKLFEEGARGFKEQLSQILEACTFSEKKIATFSATYTPKVAKWCIKNMKGLVRITIGQRNATTDLIDQELLFVGNEEGKLLAFRDLIRKGLTPPVLVFVQSKERAQQLFSELIYDGINVDAIHADRTQTQRDNTVRSFREGRIWVLICTELMARGIDFKGVNLVINYDFPPSAISYVHRVGRAGRAGRKGKAITYFTLSDTVNLRSIAYILKQSGCHVPEYMGYMKKHSKNMKKKLENSAPERDDILTIPKDERIRIDKVTGKNRLLNKIRKDKLRKKELTKDKATKEKESPTLVAKESKKATFKIKKNKNILHKTKKKPELKKKAEKKKLISKKVKLKGVRKVKS